LWLASCSHAEQRFATGKTNCWNVPSLSELALYSPGTKCEQAIRERERETEGEQGTERKGQEAEWEGEFDSGIILEGVRKSQ